jgi:hypothetical protein
MPLPRNPRRLEEDPENEPDLYAISNLYPVPAAAAPNGPKNTMDMHSQAVALPGMDQQQQLLQQQAQMILTAQQPMQPTFLAPAGLVGYPQAQFYFAAAAPTAYATTPAPQFITAYPSVVGSYPAMVAAPVAAQYAPVTQFAPAPAAAAQPQMFGSPQFIIANAAPPPVAPTAATVGSTLMNASSNGQPSAVFNFVPSNVMATSPVAPNTRPI